MKTLPSGALRYLQSALPLLFFLGFLHSPAVAGTGFGEGDDADVLRLSLSTETVQPSRKETLSLLAGICGPEHVQADKKGAPYCDKAPGYPDDDSCGLEIRGVLRGHFTSSQADEAVTDYLGGCEPHAHDYGGSILLRKEDGIWRRIAYFPGERAARCLVFPRRDGRDALVCAGSHNGQGQNETWIELFPLKPGRSEKALIELENSGGASLCESFEAGQRQSYSVLKSWERQPASQGEPERLVLQVETQSFVTPDFCGKGKEHDRLNEESFMTLQLKFDAFRSGLWHTGTVAFDWNGERFVKKAP